MIARSTSRSNACIAARFHRARPRFAGCTK
jgi:hypothetical protein